MQNDFIQTRIEDYKDMVIIKIRVVLVDSLLDIALGVYKPYVIPEHRGVKQLIVQFQNAMYDTIMTRLIYQNKFRKSL